MTSGTESKAQRRAESQRKVAERRAAELRAKRVRMTVRYGGVAVVILVVVLVIVVLSGSTPSTPAAKTAADVKTVPIPASLHLVADPPTTPGYEGVSIPIGPKLAT